MARVMYIETMSGAAGDMLLGAFIDAGLPVAELGRALGGLGVGHDLKVSRVVRAGVSATYVQVGEASAAASATQGHTHAAERAHPHDHAHTHSHGHDAGHTHDHNEAHTHAHTHGTDGHRSLADISHLIGHSALSAAGKARAIALFERLGEAEAAIHDVPVQQIHFHEVGAVDSIIDIVGCVFAMEWFGIDDVVASAMNVGGGTVDIAHGTFPVPAPATIRLLAGVPVYSAGPRMELTTPTGALLVSGFAKSYGPIPAMTVAQIGYGAGTRDFPGVPNVLRVFIGERASVGPDVSGDSAILKIECEIDDMNPQLFGVATERLFEAGALDVFLTAVQMKKGRPGTLVTVLASADLRRAMCDVLFTHTTTLGARIQRVERETLDRRWMTVPVTGGAVRIKVGERDGTLFNAAPEFDDCERVATATGRPVKDVQAEAMSEWRKAR